MKVTLDTMMWVSYCTLQDGYRHQLIERAHRQAVRIFVSDYILDELTRTLVDGLNRSRRYAILARCAVSRIAKHVTLPPVVRPFVPGDPNDDPIVQTALSGKTDYLITADAEILKLVKVQDVEILTAAQFDEKLAPEQ